MSLHSRNGIIKHLNDGRKNRFMEVVLEFLGHVVSNLADTMKSCISNLRIRMSKVLNYNWDHWSNLLNVIDVLSDLRESHDTCVFISPVLVISKCGLNEMT